jgi:hypothetical protein
MIRPSRQGLGWRYIDVMRTLSPILASIVLTASSPAGAQSFEAQRAVNSMRDMARAQERTARSLERIERQDRDRARYEDRARRNADVLSRSNRRFD